MPRRVILLPAPPGRAEPGRTSPATIIWFYFALTSWKSFKFFHTHTDRRQWSTHTVTHSHAVTPLNTRANALLTSHSLLPLFVFPSLSNVFFQLPHTDKVFNFAAETHLAQCESAPSLKCEIWNLIPLRVLECLLNIKCVFLFFYFFLFKAVVAFQAAVVLPFARQAKPNRSWNWSWSWKTNWNFGQTIFQKMCRELEKYTISKFIFITKMHSNEFQ